MHIVVCVKQIPNPEAAFSMFTVDEAARRVIPVPGLQLVMSPFDEQAVEAALRLRDEGHEVRITLLTLGSETARNVLKHGLAMGADEGVLLSDPAFESADQWLTAHALAAGIRKLGDCGLVLAGRQAADWDAGVVGAGIGELLGRPVLSFAKSVEIANGALRVERVLDDGSEIVEARIPALVTVSNELGAPRAPTLRETMRAARKPMHTWKAEDLGMAADEIEAMASRRTVERLFAPAKEGRCEFIQGTAPQQAGALVDRLRAAKLI